MEELNLNKKEIIEKDYIKKIPKNTDYANIIKKDTVVYEGGKPIIIYKVLDKKILEEFRSLVFDSKFQKSARSNGLPTQSAIYGSLPRVPNRNNYCRYTANTKSNPKLTSSVIKFSLLIDSIYKDLLPKQHKINMEIVNTNIEDDYIIKNTPFTTVNFNVNHAIRYHKDTGNFKGVYSNVLILKNGVLGGYLVCPEYDIAFEQNDGALILFDGQKIIHGVTPIKLSNDKSYRCSTVFYSLATMKNCYPFKDELQKAKEWRDKVESRWRSDPNELTGYVKEMKKINKNKKNGI